MLRTFEPHFRGADASEIEAFERQYGWKLPADYRSFLLKHNGGSPIPPHACLLKGTDEHVLVDMLFGIGLQERDLDLRTWMISFGAELPPGHLIIGGVGGLLFVLRLGVDQCDVLCWDRMGELDGQAKGASGVWYPIASSFTDFLSSLKPVEEA